MKARALTTPAKVRAWAASMRAERLNDTGRAMIDLAEELMLRAVSLRKLKHLALIAVAPHVDKAVRAALQADRGEADRSIAQLRRLAAAREAMGSRFDEIH